MYEIAGTLGLFVSAAGTMLFIYKADPVDPLDIILGLTAILFWGAATLISAFMALGLYPN